MFGPSSEFLSMIHASVLRSPRLRQTCVGNAILTFILEDDIPPLLITPVLTVDTLQTFLTMTNSKDG